MTKLTEDQKLDLKYLKANYKPKFIYFPDFGVTFAMVPHLEASNFLRVSVAYASKSEPKFSKKVGAFHAAVRLLEDDKYIIVPKTVNFYTLAYTLTDL
jgi:hypothetical protein